MDIKTLLENKNFSWIFSGKNNDGVIQGYKCIIRQLTFKFSESEKGITTLRINGSLQNFYQANNFEDFYYSEVVNAVNYLCALLNVHAHKVSIHSFEFNLTSPLEHTTCETIIEGIERKGKKVFYRYDSNDDFDGKHLKQDNNDFKVYSKSKQKKIDGEILRIEYKVITMKDLNSKEFEKCGGINIKTLKDFFHPHNFHTLKNRLIGYYKNILKSEPIDIDKLNDKELSFFKEATQPKYFEKLYKKVSNKQVDRKTPNNHIKRLKAIYERYSKEQLHDRVIANAEAKFEQLMDVDEVPILQNIEVIETLEKFPNLHNLQNTIENNDFLILQSKCIRKMGNQENDTINLCATAYTFLSEAIIGIDNCFYIQNKHLDDTYVKYSSKEAYLNYKDNIGNVRIKDIPIPQKQAKVYMDNKTKDFEIFE